MSLQPPESPVPAAGSSGPAASAIETEVDPATLSTEILIDRLQQDRQWLLRQIDAGRWPEWRLDLAALERELGMVLEQAAERRPAG